VKMPVWVMGQVLGPNESSPYPNTKPKLAS
jgi:hypothetical protein